ncbi:MAG: glucose-1-phosphate adenylyltransferase [Planctomycetes bacterium]|nr:glucose-1-phosphate adenylyltransferase [Planctomycetota bacterium]
MHDVLSLILGGGRGTRLYPLTRERSKPAVPFGGKYRLIDIPISNCINSDLRRIYVLTQFLSVSLHRHIANTYKFDPFSKGFVAILAAQQTFETSDWYQGTADAVRQNLRYIQEDRGQEVLILSGDQLYRMDYRPLIQDHREHQADVTIAVLPVPRSQVAGFGIVRLDDTGRVVGFVEKPKTEEQLEPVRTSEEWLEKRGIAGGRPYLASMGIYLFRREALLELLNTQPPATDFGKEIFPRSISTRHVQAHVYDGYWEDLGTIQSYHESNLALASDNPPFDFHSPEGVIYTHMRNLPASRISDAVLEQSLVSDGCIIQEGTRILHSVIGVRSCIGQRVTLRDSVIIGADRFETDAERSANRRGGVPDMGIGDSTLIERAIVDKNCRIGRHVRILNERKLEEDEGTNYVIRDGIVVIPKGATVPDNTVI